MNLIDCEVAQVFDRDEQKIGFSLRPLDMSEKNLEIFKSFEKSKWNEKYKSISVNYFHKNKPLPSWISKGSQINVGIRNNNGWCNIDQNTIKVLEVSDTSFDDDVEKLDDDFIAEQLEKELVESKKSETPEVKKNAKVVTKEDRKTERINQIVENYASIFRVVSSHQSLVSLDTNLKKDIATHINITLTNEGY
tara:strand:+ start:114 stop:692 length:579 start_codon:yes stop_codon:yes gene_type:complete